MIVETARLTLRPPTADDIDAYAAFRAHPQVTATLPMRFGTDGYENATRYIAMFEECWQIKGYGPWLAIERASGRLAGHVGLRFLAELDETEILWALHPDFWGRGYATEGAEAARDHAFDALALDYVIALALPTNRASIRVMERLGMDPAGEVDFLGNRVVRYLSRRAA